MCIFHFAVTAHSSAFCSALLTLNLVPGLIQLLPFSQGINTMILRVLANIAHKKKEFCVQLAHHGLLSALCATLKMADQEMVTLSMDVLFMLLGSGPQVAEEFVRQSGLSLLEAIQYNSEGEIRRRATHLLEHHLLSYSSYCSGKTFMLTCKPSFQLLPITEKKCRSLRFPHFPFIASTLPSHCQSHCLSA